MPSLTLNISPELQSKAFSLAHETNETTEQLAVRLLKEYIEDCEEANKLKLSFALAK